MSLAGQPRESAAGLDSDELLQALLAICDQGVWVVDEDNRTVLTNRRMRELMGAAPDRLQVGEYVDLSTPAATATAWRHLEYRAAGVSDRYELQVTLPGGQYRRLAISGTPRYNQQGYYVGAIAVCSEVMTGPDRPPRSWTMDEIAVSLAGQTAMTARETEILRRVLAGDRVPAIAQALFVAQSTVRNHLSGIFRKTGVHSQQELIMLLRRNRPA